MHCFLLHAWCTHGHILMQSNVLLQTVLTKASCAAVASTCGVNGTDCSLQVYVGASGDDKNGIAFNSGWMIQEINRFSVYSLYDNSKQDVSPHIVHSVHLIFCCNNKAGESMCAQEIDINVGYASASSA